MKSFLRNCAFVLVAVASLLFLLGVFRKKKKPLMQELNNIPIAYGMREIENPFDNEVLRPENQLEDVVVKIKDYKWYNMYRNDIIAICVMMVLAIMVTGLSVFSFETRVQNEALSSSEKAKADSTIIHSLGGIEETTIVMKETLDSVDVHLTEGEKNLRNAIREFKGKKGGKK